MTNSSETNRERKEEVKPIAEGLFTIPSSPEEKPHLIGTKCRSCGTFFFPKEVCCNVCFNEDMEDVLLSNRGKLYSFTVVRQRPMAYMGPLPYAMGFVDVPEGVRIMTLLAGDFEKLELDMEMEMILEPISEGDDVVAYKFRPVED